MPAPAYVTIALVVVVVLVLAAFLLGVARVLADVNRRLSNVTDAVGSIASATEPVEGVVRSINGNLATARDALNGLLESKLGASGAAELVASVDPLAEAPPTQGAEPIRYERAYEEEGAEEAPWGLLEDEAADDPRISYRRAQPAPPIYEPEPEPPGPPLGTRPPGAGGGSIRLRDPKQ